MILTGWGGAGREAVPGQGTWEQLPRAVRDAGGLLLGWTLCSPQGRSTEGEGGPGTGLGYVGCGPALGALTWRPGGTHIKSRLESDGHGVPAGEVWVEKGPTGQCCVRAGAGPGWGGPKGQRTEGRETSPGLAVRAVAQSSVPGGAGVSAGILQSGKVLLGRGTGWVSGAEQRPAQPARCAGWVGRGGPG